MSYSSGFRCSLQPAHNPVTVQTCRSPSHFLVWYGHILTRVVCLLTLAFRSGVFKKRQFTLLLAVVFPSVCFLALDLLRRDRNVGRYLLHGPQASSQMRMSQSHLQTVVVMQQPEFGKGEESNLATMALPPFSLKWPFREVASWQNSSSGFPLQVVQVSRMATNVGRSAGERSSGMPCRRLQV